MTRHRELLWGALILVAVAGGARLLLHKPGHQPTMSSAATAPTVLVTPGAAATPWTDWAQLAPVLDLNRHQQELAVERSFSVDGVSLGMTRDKLVAALGPPHHDSNMYLVEMLQYRDSTMVMLKSDQVYCVMGHRLLHNGQLLCQADQPLGRRAMDSLGSPVEVGAQHGLAREWRTGPVSVILSFRPLGEKPPEVLQVTLSSASGL